MAKSSRYMQALFGVVSSGMRRRPVYIRQQALVSKAYPLFIEPESVAPVFSFRAGGRLWVPPSFAHQVIPAFSFLAGGTLEDFDPLNNYAAEPESVEAAFSFLAGGTLDDYDPFVNYGPEIEQISPALAFRAGGFMYDAAVRHTQPAEDMVSPTFSFRAGGTLSG